MLALLLFATTLIGHGAPPEAAALDLPRVGDRALRLLSPTVLELTLVTQGKERWDFTDPARMPTQLAVLAEGKPLAIAARGFRRRTLYAPLKRHDLRVGCSLYLELASPIPSGAEVRVRDPAHELGPEEVWWGTLASSRESPVIHVNQAGYAPGHHKRATIGAFLGTLGELKLPAELAFSLVDEAGKAVFQGKLRPRPDGAFKPPAYQRVLEADFTAFETPGTYRVEVATLGRSMPFTIDDAQPALLARTYALGMLHQRCGFALELPFTRFTHPACHLDPVAPASDADKSVLARLARNEASHHPKQTAPALTRPSASLMPFSSQEPRAIFGGHHDAGDYGRYTENSAALVHTLVFAADNFPGVAALDNLGLPESGDGKGDVLQLAAWEAEYLLRLQDPAGGFATYLQPQGATYDGPVRPDKARPQVAFPQTLMSTSAGVAALAQVGTSPAMKAQLPDLARRSLAAAQKGFAYLDKIIAERGAAGTSQHVGRNGETYDGLDALAWATVELFLATGDKALQERLVKTFDPGLTHWGWQRLPEANARAVRSYAFAARSGRRKLEELDPALLARCEKELRAQGADFAAWARSSAYGTPLPSEARRLRRLGWYFSSASAFDLSVAALLDDKPELSEAIDGAFDYELGENPLDVTFVTGLGWKREHVVVSQFAESGRESLPPTGLLVGSVTEGVAWIGLYKREMLDLTWPFDSDPAAPYPLYDRWTDTFNLSAEGSTFVQASSLAAAALRMARSPLAKQAWRAQPGRIEASKPLKSGEKIELKLVAEGLELSQAQIVWDAQDAAPVFGRTATYVPTDAGTHWVEAEAVLPDGRRVMAQVDLVIDR